MAILVIPLFKTGEWPTKQVKRTFGIHHFHPHCGVSEWPSYLQERSNTSATFSSRSSLPPWECRFPCHPSNPFWPPCSCPGPPCSCPAPCCSFAGWAFSCWSTCAAVEVAVVKTCWDGICRLLSSISTDLPHISFHQTSDKFLPGTPPSFRPSWPRLGGTPRLGILATLNLSQISEFALVICSLGMGYGHIDPWRLVKLTIQGSRGWPADSPRTGSGPIPTLQHTKNENRMQRRTRMQASITVFFASSLYYMEELMMGLDVGWWPGSLINHVEWGRPNFGPGHRAQDASTLEIIIWVTEMSSSEFFPQVGDSFVFCVCKPWWVTVGGWESQLFCWMNFAANHCKFFFGGGSWEWGQGTYIRMLSQGDSRALLGFFKAKPRHSSKFQSNIPNQTANSEVVLGNAICLWVLFASQVLWTWIAKSSFSA